MASSSEVAWTTARVRNTFIDFFGKKQHTFVPSAPVVPLHDPTLLFVNSGMAQFKAKFLGLADNTTEFGKMARAANSQICIRAGGKHNDLDDVGHDTYHHTLFEMLGSWSFGDYFKKDAINWAWELLTEVYKVPKERLYVTYFEGTDKVPADEEARQLWRQHVPDERIIRGNAKDNFWEMGDTGPCGPCTEIHFDYIGNRDAAALVNKDDPTVVEIWNVVFMQFNRAEKGGSLVTLPAQHVDTGMGLERITTVLQGKKSNYDIDLWQPLFKKLQEVTKFPQSYEELVASDAAKDPKSKEALAIVAYRVCADHARTLTVALADGAAPDRQGRGFVLRRIIRRAVRYGVQFLNAEFGFFEQLVQPVADILGPHFSYVAVPRTVRRVQTLIRDEELGFARTWKTGLKHFETAVEASRKANSNEINPQDSFDLHDRYGFPIDLTKLLAQREGLIVDVDKFNEVMKREQVGGGRMAAAKGFFDAYQTDELEKNRKLPTTDDSAKYVWERLDRGAKVLAIFDRSKKEFVNELAIEDAADRDPETVGIVLDRTNFYCESGGQIFDQGTITSHGAAGTSSDPKDDDSAAGAGTVAGGFDVKRAFAFAGYAVHIGDLSRGKIRVGDVVSCDVDYERRQQIASNHTSTHLLNFCLRETLQYAQAESVFEVNQRGSLVTDDCLRFDFSWNSKLTAAELVATEKLFNKVVQVDKLPVYTKAVPLEKAKVVKGLRMEFDVKYGADVIVVSIGKDIDSIIANPNGDLAKQYSVELCGGTHIRNMQEAKAGVIISEDSLTKGVRRITMFTGDAAVAAIALAQQLRGEFGAILKTQTDDYDGKAKQFTVLNKKVGDTPIPLVEKMALRDDIEKAVKDTLAERKNAVTKLKAAAVELGQTLAKSHSQGAKFSVLRIPDPKLSDKDLVQTVIDSFLAALAGGAAPAAAADGAAAAAAAAAANVSVLFIGADAAKAIAVAIVAPAHAAQINAVDWIKSACNGKGGGKPTAGQGGLSAGEVDQGLASATAFAKSKGL